jgi:hypothetical protein
MLEGNSLKVNLKRFKEFALTGLPRGSTLRDLILSEKDELNAEEFLAKMDI